MAPLFLFFLLFFFHCFLIFCLVFSCVLLGLSSIATATTSYTSSQPSPPSTPSDLTMVEPLLMVKPLKLQPRCLDPCLFDLYMLIHFNHHPNHHHSRHHSPDLTTTHPSSPLSSHDTSQAEPNPQGWALVLTKNHLIAFKTTSPPHVQTPPCLALNPSYVSPNLTQNLTTSEPHQTPKPYQTIEKAKQKTA